MKAITTVIYATGEIWIRSATSGAAESNARKREGDNDARHDQTQEKTVHGVSAVSMRLSNAPR